MNRSQSVNIIPVTNNSAQSTSDKPSECKPKVIHLKRYGKNIFVYQKSLIQTFHIDYMYNSFSEFTTQEHKLKR